MPTSARIFIAVFLLFGCDPTQTPSTSGADFEAPTSAPELNAPDLTEASGIVAGRTSAGLLWSHNDSGDQARIFLLGSDGKQRAVYQVEGATNRDWEDITLTDINGVPTIFVGDIGDNDATYSECYIYRFAEPKNGGETSGVIRNVEKITYRYPDGARDAETLLVDQQTKDLYVISKRETQVRVYRLKYPQATTGVLTAEFITEIPFTYLTAGSISADNSEVILRNYSEIYYWKRNSGEDLGTTLKRTTRKLPYLQEIQGEGLCFAADDGGYYTISEKAAGIQPRLYFYKRK